MRKLYTEEHVQDIADSIRNKLSLTGKNYIQTTPDKWQQGAIESATGLDTESTTRIKTDFIEIDDVTADYYVSLESTGYTFLNIIMYDANKGYVWNYYSIDKNINGTRGLKINFSSYNKTKYIRVVLRNTTTSANITPSEVTTARPMMIKGSSKTPYEAYCKYKVSEMSDAIDSIQTGSEDNIKFITKTLSYPDIVDAKHYLITQSELIELGLIETGESFLTKWNHFIIRTSANVEGFTTTTNQVALSEASTESYPYSTTYPERGYKRLTRYHTSSTTSLSTMSDYNTIASSTNGYIGYDASGIFYRGTTTYRMGTGTYTLLILCWQ